MWDLKGFVASMLAKPSVPAGATKAATSDEANEVLQLLLKLMRRQLEKGTKGEKAEALCKVKLAELILPQVVNPPTKDGKETELVDHDKAKDWAFACAQMLGFLAGLSLQDDAIDGAISEAASVAKTGAHQTSEALQNMSPALTGKMPEPRKERKDHTTGVNAATRKSADMLTQKESMIKDLETEAMIEDGKSNPAAAAALRVMAERMKKEVEIERDLNKTGKSAA